LSPEKVACSSDLSLISLVRIGGRAAMAILMNLYASNEIIRCYSCYERIKQMVSAPVEIFECRDLILEALEY
jgi:hypothetical protein